MESSWKPTTSTKNLQEIDFLFNHSPNRKDWEQPVVSRWSFPVASPFYVIPIAAVQGISRGRVKDRCGHPPQAMVMVKPFIVDVEFIHVFWSLNSIQHKIIWGWHWDITSGNSHVRLGLDNHLVLANIQLNSTRDASSFRRHNAYNT